VRQVGYLQICTAYFQTYAARETFRFVSTRISVMYGKWRHAVKQTRLSPTFWYLPLKTLAVTSYSPANLSVLADRMFIVLWETYERHVYKVWPFIFCILVTPFFFSIHVFTHDVYSHNSPHNSFLTLVKTLLIIVSKAVSSPIQNKLLYWISCLLDRASFW